MSHKKYFSLPADFKKETIDKYKELNDSYPESQVIETYGNITIGNPFESGRIVSLLPGIDWTQFREYVEYSRQQGIAFSYTMNGPHMHNKEFSTSGISGIMKFLNALSNAGVQSVTAALPSLIDIIRSSGSGLKVKASVICEITNANKALVYKNWGVDRIVVDESMNRDFTTLKQILQVFGPQVELIANCTCLKDCVYRMFHYNQIAFDSLESTDETAANYYNHRCLLRRYENPVNFIKLNWIRPEDIKYYTKIGIHYFKLQGRQAVLKGDPVRTLECYFKESYDGDLLDLLEMFDPHSSFRISIENKRLEGFIEKFYQNGTGHHDFCRRICSECGYCESFARSNINFNEVRQVYDLAKEFYSEYDGFKLNLDRVKNEPGNSKKKDRAVMNQRELDLGGDFRLD